MAMPLPKIDKPFKENKLFDDLQNEIHEIKQEFNLPVVNRKLKSPKMKKNYSSDFDVSFGEDEEEKVNYNFISIERNTTEVFRPAKKNGQLPCRKQTPGC